jgi:hypothetical protein
LTVGYGTDHRIRPGVAEIGGEEKLGERGIEAGEEAVAGGKRPLKRGAGGKCEGIRESTKDDGVACGVDGEGQSGIDCLPAKERGCKDVLEAMVKPENEGGLTSGGLRGSGLQVWPSSVEIWAWE